MKKAKMMLVAIATFGVVGGVLAFKAKDFGIHTFYGCTTTVGNVTGCFKPFITSRITTVGPGITIPYSSTTVVTDCFNGGTCTALVTTFAAE
jgi:hypothetical protein